MCFYHAEDGLRKTPNLLIPIKSEAFTLKMTLKMMKKSLFEYPFSIREMDQRAKYIPASDEENIEQCKQTTFSKESSLNFKQIDLKKWSACTALKIFISLRTIEIFV